MHWVVRVAAGLIAGYLLGAAQAFSGNVHDKDLEAAMTAAFATGPLGAALGAALALFWSRRR
jgi:hypothetical protein